MQIQKNSRQIPKAKEITSNKNYFDLLYAHLQVISYRDEATGKRFVPYKQINFSKLAEDLNSCRQTISTKFKYLMKIGLIIPPPEGTKDDYELAIINKDLAFLLPFDTLRKMVSTFNERTISIYIYLANRYLANNEKAYNFSLDAIKGYCGLSTKTRSNNYLISDPLDILQTLGLIKYHTVTFNNDTSYYLDYLINTLK